MGCSGYLSSQGSRRISAGWPRIPGLAWLIRCLRQQCRAADRKSCRPEQPSASLRGRMQPSATRARGCNRPPRRDQRRLARHGDGPARSCHPRRAAPSLARSWGARLRVEGPLRRQAVSARGDEVAGGWSLSYVPVLRSASHRTSYELSLPLPVASAMCEPYDRSAPRALIQALKRRAYGGWPPAFASRPSYVAALLGRPLRYGLRHAYLRLPLKSRRLPASGGTARGAVQRQEKVSARGKSTSRSTAPSADQRPDAGSRRDSSHHPTCA